MSKVLSHPWALPSFSIIAAAVFITVHLTSGDWSESPSLSNGGETGSTVETGKEVAGGDLGTDQGVRPFTYVPTSSPNENNDLVPVPTTIVFGHNVPQPGGDGGDGPGLTWNIPFGEPTPDPALLYDPATPPALINNGDGGGGGWGYPPGYPTPDPAQLNGGNSGSPVILKWSIPLGQPTPDPALLLDPGTPPFMKEIGSPINLSWNIPLGEPTPDPAQLYDPATPPALINNGLPTRNPARLNGGYSGSPVIMKWSIPLGQPTPDPALLLDPGTPPFMKEVGSPINLSWNIPLGEPTPDPALLNPSNGSPINLSWGIPLGEPTPDPALLNPSNGNPINLSWGIPLGEPTPDPALLNPSNGNPVNLSWGIPLGEPTPDPALLNPSNGKPVILKWNIPYGEPTPDPAQLNPSNGKPIVLKWNIPYGLPTPDPAQLGDNVGSPIVIEWSAPYPRPLEFGTISPSKPGDTLAPSSAPSSVKPSSMPTSEPTSQPSSAPSAAPVPEPTIAPSAAPTPKPPTPMPVLPPTPLPLPPPTPMPVRPPTPLPLPPPPPQTPPPVPPPTPLPLPPQTPPPVPPQPVPPPPVPPPPQPFPPPPVPVPPRPVPGPGAKDATPGSAPGPGSAAVWVPGKNGVPTWYSGGGGSMVNPLPLVVPHNQVFLEGCNPLNCTLNEASDFHSMSREDESIYEIFYTNPIKCCRVIVEIGAGDGNRFSFSQFFERGLNWRSLLIEANPDVYQELKANRPTATTKNGAFCESGHLEYSNAAFSSLGGSIEISSEVHSPPNAGAGVQEIPCLSMDSVFADYGITKVDVMVVRLQGDALAFIRAMDWTVRVDIWVILMHGATKADRDELVRKVLKGNEYVQAEWDIKRWCSDNGTCLNNEVFLRKGFNPLPSEIQDAMAVAGARPARNLRGKF